MSEYALKNVGIPTKVLIGGAEESEEEKSEEEVVVKDSEKDLTLKSSASVPKEHIDWIMGSTPQQAEVYRNALKDPKKKVSIENGQLIIRKKSNVGAGASF